MSWAEKRLLEAKYLQKKKQFQKALKVLQALSGLPDVLEAYRCHLLANVKDSLGQPFDLVEQRTLCAALQTLRDESGYFTATIDLALELSIQGEQSEALSALQSIRPLQQSDWQKANWLRCSALVHARLGDRAQFTQTATELRKSIKELKPFHGHLCLTAIAYGLTLTGDLEESLKQYAEILEKYRSTDVFIDRFWFLLLRTLVHGDSLPATPAALRARESFFQRYNIVRSLQCGEVENASLDWKRLQESRPTHYGDSFSMRFEYLERTALGRSIRLFMKKKPTIPTGLDLESLSPLVRTFANLLAGAPTPLRRPQLIEMLYHAPYSPKFDKRFYQLVITAKKAGVPIRNRSGAYSIDM